MAPVSWARLGLVAALAAAGAWLLTRMAVGAGMTPLAMPWTLLAVSLGGAVLALGLGWSVRQYRKGKNPSLSALRAARTVVYAQACAYAGALLTGALGGYALALEWHHGPRREVAISALVAALGTAALAVGGLIAEHWCKDDGRDDDRGTPEGMTA